ncbi:MAG: CinA family nicotinamide mononucleotide deamidase-related protein [Thermodesulfobacteriota bacterium]
MLGEIIAIGDELTSGRILNTTSFFAASKLFAAGHEIIAMATVGDSAAAIEEALEKALNRADFVLVTGGLGPTTDDRTNETVSRVLRRPVTLYPEILARIRASAAGRDPEAQARLEKLAWLPAGAEVLNPQARMAGYLLVHSGKPIFFLPGVPHEMRELLVERVIPWLDAWAEDAGKKVGQRLYKVFGLEESAINQRLALVERDHPRVRIGYYPVFPEVHLSLTAIDEDEAEVERLLAAAGREVEARLAGAIFGHEGTTMASEVGRLLGEAKRTLAVAESCTGGLVCQALVRVPGISASFEGGVVAYSNRLKEQVLAVPVAILAARGAVSAETAQAMAQGVRRLAGAHLGLGLTGIAGPGGGSADKPVGTVYIALAWEGGGEVHRFLFSGDRWQIQELAAHTGLDLVRRRLLVVRAGA